MKQKQYAEAKKGWEERTGDKTVGVRLSEDYRAKLGTLAACYGGNRQAIEAAIDILWDDMKER